MNHANPRGQVVHFNAKQNNSRTSKEKVNHSIWNSKHTKNMYAVHYQIYKISIICLTLNTKYSNKIVLLNVKYLN